MEEQVGGAGKLRALCELNADHRRGSWGNPGLHTTSIKRGGGRHTAGIMSDGTIAIVNERRRFDQA